mmetsp:Transcript_123313/g.320455  ORF Transcript_123313/g.320455 Transcript_123313/m.320455 type:complete len:82 (-) Transcript_123313:130-375(-)
MGQEKAGELVLTSAGALQHCEGDWGGEQDSVAAGVWKVLREVKHLLAPTETLKRVTVSFQGREYVVTGKDSQYFVVRWNRA